ncbi:hypothetical protein J3A83DRAFT_187769 [Scleroderma citrinum]
MHFASIVSLLAIASGVIAQNCASCHIQTDGQSSLTFEDGCALPQGGAKCHYSVHDGSPVKDIYCQYYSNGNAYPNQRSQCYPNADVHQGTCINNACPNY